MAETSTVARPYAKAAFEYACEQQVLESWSEWLTKLGQVVAVRDAQKLLSSPKLNAERKVELIVELADVTIDDAAKRFLTTLGEKGRLGEIGRASCRERV